MTDYRELYAISPEGKMRRQEFNRMLDIAKSHPPLDVYAVERLLKIQPVSMTSSYRNVSTHHENWLRDYVERLLNSQKEEKENEPV